MPRQHHYFVYILASRSRTLYIGVTSNLSRRLAQHRAGKHDSFTTRYRIHRIVHVEHFQYIGNAITRESSSSTAPEPKRWPSSSKPIKPGKTWRNHPYEPAIIEVKKPTQTHRAGKDIKYPPT